MSSFAAQRSWSVFVPTLGAAALAANGIASRSSLRCEEEKIKLPIYSSPPEPVILAEVRGPLEEQVAAGRKFILNATQTGRQAIGDRVDRWIGVEKAVETKVSSLIPNDESITPGILYVGVATLAGSVFTRYRSFPIRILTPPLFLVGSLNYFLPRTAHNVSQYYLELESTHLPPAVRQQRENALKLWRQSVGSAKVNLEKAKAESSKLVHKGLASVEQGTGLKVGGIGSSAQPSSTTEGKKMV